MEWKGGSSGGQTYGLLAKGGTKHPLAALVQLGHDDVLALVGRGLGREVDDDGFEDLLVKLVQQEVLYAKIQSSTINTCRISHFHNIFKLMDVSSTKA